MAEIAIGPQVATGRVGSEKIADDPNDGWITLLLHTLVMGVTAMSVVRVDQQARDYVLVPLALGGLFIGFILARTPALDAISHILAIGAGAVATLILCTVRVDGASILWEQRGRNIIDFAERVIVSHQLGVAEKLPDDDQIAVIGLTLWLVGYSSAWMLYRRRWLFPALLVPVTLVFVCLRFEDSHPTWTLATISVACMIMAARHHAVTRQIEWSRRRIPSPRGLAGKFTVCGVVIAAVALIAGWLVPFQAPASFADDLADAVQPRWDQAAAWLEKTGLLPDGAALPQHTYSEFSDSFENGRQFVPSEDPVATYNGTDAPYLILRRYDYYTGQGWKSNVDARFRLEDEDDDTSVTDVTFQAGSEVNLSDELMGESRTKSDGQVTVLKPQGALVFTTDTFLSVNVPYWAVMDWVHLDDQHFNVENTRPSDVHIQLRGLFEKLQVAQFEPDPDTGNPVVTDELLRASIEQELTDLKRLPIEATFVYDANDEVDVVITGRLPNYDDIEAVFDGTTGNRSIQYDVTGSISYASEDELRTAGVEYPDWIADRYLQGADAATDRTVQLADEIVASAGAANPFDISLAIQEYLRTNYDYEINSDTASDGEDTVDFFLFDDRIGRCEDYASAMVVMLRTQGIPARIVGGFRASDELDQDGHVLYREKQAHTWVEVFFPGFGWIPFEPTRNVDQFTYGEEQVQEDPANQQRTEQREALATPEPTPEPTPESTPSPQLPVPEPRSNSDGFGGGLSQLLGIAAMGLTLAAALVAGGTAFMWVWSLRGLRPGAALFARTIRLGRFWGIEPDPAMTPREYALRFGQAVPGARSAVAIVAELYGAERYGGIEISEETERGGLRAWRTLRSSIFSWRPWGRHKRG